MIIQISVPSRKSFLPDTTARLSYERYITFRLLTSYITHTLNKLITEIRLR